MKRRAWCMEAQVLTQLRAITTVSQCDVASRDARPEDGWGGSARARCLPIYILGSQAMRYATVSTSSYITCSGISALVSVFVDDVATRSHIFNLYSMPGK